MKLLLPFVALLLAPVAALADNQAQISTPEFLAAIKRADPSVLNGVKTSRLTTASVRVLRCIGPDEEPTEFECSWQTRGKNGWVNHTNWLAIDASGWQVIG